VSGLLLGVDVGTQSTKGVLVTPDGTVVKSHTVAHGMSVPQPGWAEQDADKIWWADTVAVCRALLDGAPYSGADVTAAAFSAIGPCLLPLDSADRPLRPGILYGVDARASEEIDLLNRQIGAERILEHSGMALTSQAIGPKILWLKRHEPEVWARTAHLTTASSYLVLRLTGEKVMDRHTASHYMPLIDIKRLQWDNRLSPDLVNPAWLPRLGWSDELAGTVSESAAAETGLKAGTPVAVGAVDALSEAVSVGVVQPGDLMVMYGTTTFFILVLEGPLRDERVWSTAGAFRGQYNLAAGMATTGAVTKWLRDEFTRELPPEEAYGSLFGAAGAVPPGSGGLLVLPYFSGERTPINDPQARGVIAGLSLAHGRGHLFRAALEGVAYGVRHNFEAFASMGAPVKRVVAVGGGTRGSLWPQIVSDVSGAEQVIPETTVGASFGDAFLAGLASGVLTRSDLDRWVRPGSIVRPDPAKRGLYDRMYRDYLALYEGTRPVVHDLAAVAAGGAA
jgi:xylulokinase